MTNTAVNSSGVRIEPRNLILWEFLVRLVKTISNFGPSPFLSSNRRQKDKKRDSGPHPFFSGK